MLPIFYYYITKIFLITEEKLSTCHKKKLFLGENILKPKTESQQNKIIKWENEKCDRKMI